MFYTAIKSGLGNQMFQYAYGYTAAKKAGLDLSLDTSAYGRQFAKDTPRNFTLQHFNIEAKIATDEETARFHTTLRFFLRRVRNKLWPFANMTFYPKEFAVKDGQYKEGYWQNEKYFIDCADDIRRQFTLKAGFGPEASRALDEIRACKEKGIITVLVHVRRGDFVTNVHARAEQGALDIDYFKRGIDLIAERIALKAKMGNDFEKNIPSIHIFFASDDIPWVLENIKTDFPSSAISAPGIKDYEELLIMSNCDHFVISNSSFSWWAAWLSTNPNKIVIAPKRWRVDNADTSDATPPNWLRI